MRAIDSAALRILYRLHRYRARLPLDCTRRRRIAMAVSRLIRLMMKGA